MRRSKRLNHCDTLETDKKDQKIEIYKKIVINLRKYYFPIIFILHTSSA